MTARSHSRSSARSHSRSSSSDESVVVDAPYQPRGRPPTVLREVIRSLDDAERHIIACNLDCRTSSLPPEGIARIASYWMCSISARGRRQHANRLTIKCDPQVLEYVQTLIVTCVELHMAPRGCLFRPPPLRRFSFVIQSFGLRTSGHYVRSQFDRYRALDEAFVADHFPEYDVLASCMEFPDPNHGHLRGHCGLHPRIMTGVVESVELIAWLHHVLHLLFSRQRSALTRIGLYCRSGRHRSVACSCILAHVLRRKGYTASCECRNAFAWRRICGGPRRCWECRGCIDELVDYVDNISRFCI